MNPAQVIMNTEAEACLLGGLMLDNGLIDRVADILRPNDFGEQPHRLLYSALLREHDLGNIANPVTLRPYFDAHPAFEPLGGAGYLAQLTGSPAVVVGTLSLARQVADLAVRRQLAERLLLVALAAQDYETTTEQLLADAEGAVTDAGRGMASGITISADKAAELALNAMTAELPPGVRCIVIPGLDFVLGTIRGGHLVLLAGRPGQGKTATALTYCHGAAREGDGVLFISLEMRAEELGGRLACDVAHFMGHPVLYSRVTDGGASAEDRRSISRATLALRELPLVIEDLPSATVGRVSAIVRRQARRFAALGQPLRLVVVDYLQLLRPNKEGRGQVEAVGEISRALKAIAKSENVAVLALSQLSREVEKRNDKRPVLPDLRWSGDLEQDADSVVFVYRAEQYAERDRPDENAANYNEWHRHFEKVRGGIEFICAKRRGGRTGTARGRFLGEFQAVR